MGTERDTGTQRNRMHASRRRAFAIAMLAMGIMIPASGAMGQRMSQAGPVSASEVGVSGRFTPEPTQDESTRTRDRSSRAESRRTRSLIRLGIWGVVGIGALIGGVAAKSGRSPRHADGGKGRHARGASSARMSPASTVPPGSTRFR